MKPENIAAYCYNIIDRAEYSEELEFIAYVLKPTILEFYKKGNPVFLSWHAWLKNKLKIKKQELNKSAK